MDYDYIIPKAKILPNFIFRPSTPNPADSSEVEIHLAGGHLPSEGIPEVRCHPDDDWSTICNDLQWDVRDCRVICKQMGYKTCTSWRGDTNYDLDGKDILFSSVTCGLDERNILECSGERDPTDCDFDGDGVAWMSCGHGELNILERFIQFKTAITGR